ncbi:MAG: DUF2065 family protein [Proteobacteria bacterium]|nr:DUF2065 family protein [Pseudomonadota bacterium]
MGELLAALCLVAVIEGLFLLLAPQAWKRAAEQLLALPDRQVRMLGAMVLGIGLLALWLVRL